MENLSERDRAVLRSIFDPTATIGDVVDDGDNFEDEPEAMADLDRALQLTEGSRSRARALCLCQRGVLLRKRGADDAARRDFAAAAELGSGFAKKQIVELNPYAALCNKMLSQVMRGEKEIKL